MPEVSIITPVFNSSKFLEETIASVLNQTFTDWEWLITDDCSEDNSVEILKHLNNSRIKIFSTEKNSGAGSARNISLKRFSVHFLFRFTSQKNSRTDVFYLK